MAIEFIQHIMPHGRREMIHIDREADVEARAQVLRDKGCSFHAEMLSDYRTISLTVEYQADEDEGDIAAQLCQNGPDVPLAVDKLVEQAERYFERQAA